MVQKRILLSTLFIVGLGLTWFVSQPTNYAYTNTPQEKSNQPSVTMISPKELALLSDKPSTFVIDVHTPEQTHIPETDAFIPYDRIVQDIDKLPTDKNTPIVVYCRSGGMSAQASKELISLGYTNVYDLEGGTNAYREQQVSVSLWPNEQSLGTVIYGDVASLSYTLTNYTPLPITITRVSTSCGCTKATVEATKLDAYQSTIVDVIFDPAVHKDDTDLGDLTRSIYIETDNSNFPKLETMFSATVVK